MSLRRRALVSIVAAMVVLLTACSGLPTSGPVNEGLAAGDDAGTPEFLINPDEPQVGATPEQIVEGFIRAGSGPGASATWDVARMFLAPSFRDVWQPEAGVTVDLQDDREVTSSTTGAVAVSIVPVANVDENGAYQPAEAGVTPLSFRLEQQDDGEWRITEAPDGVIVDRDVFTRVFHRYSLMYFDPSWQFLVPDVRWFPTTNVATRIAEALVDGAPSAWLAESVRNAFPESVSLARRSVPLDDSGVAQVPLSAEALLVESTTLDRMQTQLAASLATANIAGAQMSVASTSLPAEAISTRSTRVTGPPLVLTEQGFGFLSGDELTTVPGLSDAIALVDPAAIQVSADREFAAVRLVNGSVARVPAEGDIAVIDTRTGLVDPTADPFGYIWSVPREQPAELTAFSDGGVRVDVADAWPGATQITDLAVSRDGARVAALVVAGGRSEIWVAGVVRGADNAPVRIGTPVSLGDVTGIAASLAWLDDTTVGAVSTGTDGSRFTEQLVGGPASTVSAPQGAASVAGATSISSARLWTTDGSLYVKRGANWQRTSEDILLLATQQGSTQQ